MDAKQVLVVEDDKRTAEVLGHTLETLGYRVCYATNAEKGRDLAGHADLIFLDLKLPGESGGEMLESLRLSGNYIPVVIMSAVVPREEALQKLKKFGIVDFLDKPFSLKEISVKAKKACDMSENMHSVSNGLERLKGFIERQQR